MKHLLGKRIVRRQLLAKQLLATLTTLLIVAHLASAQPAPSIVVRRDAADSAAVARTEFRAAREALARFDTLAALNKLTDAAGAWPSQPAYTRALLDLALRAHDTKRVAHALELANRIGVAVPSSASLLMDSLPQAESVWELRKIQNALRAPVARSQVFRFLSDSTLFPEGLSVVPRHGTMYVSSIHHRNVLALASDGRSYLLLRGEHATVGGIWGIVVDPLRGLLWAASAPTPEMSAKGDAGRTFAALLAIRLSDRQLVRRIAIPAGVANSSPGDIALCANGDVLVSDSQSVIDRTSVATSPTGGVVVKDQFIYIANSLWELLDAAGRFPEGVVLPRPVLLSVPLRR